MSSKIVPSSDSPTLRAQAARWITRDADLVAQVAEAILREAAWWTAARAHKYAHPTILRADEHRAPISNRRGAAERFRPDADP